MNIVKVAVQICKGLINIMRDFLFRYNALGQLVCVLCNLQVKSEILWNTHLQSRKHKEQVNALKAAKAAPPNPSSSSTLSSSVSPSVDGSRENRGMSTAKGHDPQKAMVDKGKRKLEVRGYASLSNIIAGMLMQ